MFNADELLKNTKTEKKVNEALDHALVSKANQAYKSLYHELEAVNDFLESAKPEHADSDAELKQCIQECDLLMSVLKKVTGIKA